MSLLDIWVLFMVVGTAALFVAGVWVLSGLARRHRDDDERAGVKVTLAVVFAILLGAGGLFALMEFQDQSTQGSHRTFVATLNRTMGEGGSGICPQCGYLEATSIVAARDRTIGEVVLPRLAAINGTLDQYVAENPEAKDAVANGTLTSLPAHIAENVTARDDMLVTLKNLRLERGTAEVTARKLTPNHALWQRIEPMLQQGRDDEVEAMVLKTLDAATVTEVLPLDEQTAANLEAPCARDSNGFCERPLRAVALDHSFRDEHNHLVAYADGVPQVFADQREFNHQMDAQLKVLAYSSLTGLVMAPFAFAGGAILRSAYVPSASVGFKPYPGKAAGFFLLLGAFGVFAIPFAAWTLRDLHKRSIEGQIAL